MSGPLSPEDFEQRGSWDLVQTGDVFAFSNLWVKKNLPAPRIEVILRIQIVSVSPSDESSNRYHMTALRDDGTIIIYSQRNADIKDYLFLKQRTIP